jgi:hypothetical protein
MARLNIDTGTAGNPATGDTLRTAMTKANSNFEEVYQLVGDGSTGLLTTSITNGDLKLQANGTGAIEIDNLTITNSAITSITTNSDVTISGNGTGNVVLESLTVNGTTLSSSDSSKITLAESVDITGDLTVSGAFDLEGLAVGTLDVDNLNFNDNIISSDSNADIILTPGGTGDVVAGAIRIHGTSLSADDSSTININEGLIVDGDLTVSGSFDLDSGISITDNTITTSASNANLEINASGSGTVVLENLKVGTGETVTTILDEDAMGSNSATALATQQSIKAYVDSTVTGQDLDITADDSTALSIDLDSETLHFAGGTGITTTVSGKTVSHAIDGTVATLAGSQTLTNKTLTNAILSPTATTAGKVEFLEGTDNGTNKATLIGPASTADVTITLPAATDTLVGKATTDTFTNKSIDFDNNTITNIEVDNLKSGVLDTDISSVAGTDTTLASAKAIKTYVDAQVTLQDLDVQGDSGTIDIDLDSETLDIAGGTNITTAGAGTTLTVNLDTALTGLTSVAVDNITISDNIITTNASNANLELSANGTGVVKIDGGIDIGDANISFGTATTTSSSAANMDTFTAATFRSAKYQVSIVDSTNTRFGIYEVFVTHDGSSAFINAQGISDTSLDLATFSADIDSGSVRVRVVPISDASTVFKFVRTVFAV